MIRPPPISTLFPYTTLFRSTLVDHRQIGAGPLSILTEPWVQIRICPNRQARIEGTQAVQDERGMRACEFGAVRAGGFAFHRLRLGEMAVGGNAGQRLGIEKARGGGETRVDV